MRARPALRVALMAVAVLAAEPASAQPVERVEVASTGACPDEAALARELGPIARTEADPDGPAWTLRVTRAGRVARMTLTDPTGRVALTRRIRSRDCAALARAFAAIVRVHLRDLPALPGRADEVRPPTGAAGSAPAPPPPAAEVEAERSALPPETETPAAPGPAPRAGLTLAVAGGVQQAMTPMLTAAVGGVDLTWRPAGGPWLARAVVVVSSPTTQELAPETDAPPQRVRLQEIGARAETGLRLEREPWFVQSSVGVGLVIARATALDIAARPDRTRAQPTAALALAGGRRLSGPWRLRAEFGGRVFWRRDRYLVDPVGTVARSPRFELSLGLGVEFELISRIASPGSGH